MTHSFPTRRSSDLVELADVLQRVAADVAGEADHRLGDVAEQVQAAVDDVAEGIAGVADQDARAIERAAGEPATGEQDRVAAQHRAGGIEQAIGAVADVGNQVAGVVAEDLEAFRSEGRREGKEWVSSGRSQWTT